MSTNTENFNDDELVTPPWINNELLTKVLHSCQSDSTIKVTSFKLTPGSGKGDHYASVMFRANVDFKSAKQSKLQSMSMIIKTMPESEGHKKDMFKESHIFETEIAMYSKVIPKFEAILRAIGDETIMGARCLYYSLAPKKFIIFEDIIPLGYNVLRGRQVNMEEAKVAYLKLAKWHAISYKINKENPNYFDQFVHSFMNQPDIMEQTFITDGIGNFIALLETQPQLIKYKPYFENMQKDLIVKCRSSFVEYRENAQPKSHYVLCHGDFHAKNMMFKRSSSSGQLQDVMLLDFQMCYMGPMVLDVINSFYMLLDKELRAQHLDELIYYYFSNFVDTLQKIGYDGAMPKLIQFRQMLMQHKHYDIFLLTTFLPLWYAVEESNIEGDQIFGSSDLRRTLYHNKYYIAVLEECLPKYLHMGYLEN